MSASRESLGKIAGIVLLRSDGAALFQLRDDKPGMNAPGQWVFPGGHCRADEACADCARREFQEETGYLCRELEPITELAHTSPETGHQSWQSFWRADYDGVCPISCFEGQEMRFIPRSQIEGKPVPPYLIAIWDLALAAKKGDSTEQANGGTHNAPK